MIYHTVLACATLLNLSMTTKIEMQKLLPHAASYCITNPQGRLSVSYGPMQKSEEPSRLPTWGSDQYESNAVTRKARSFGTGR